MNAPSRMLTRDAVRAARQSHPKPEAWYEFLRAQTGLDSASLTREVAHGAGVAAVQIEQLHQREPAFDVVRYVEAVRRGVVATRDQQSLYLAVPDPFDDRLFNWAASLPSALTIECAHPADIRAYLVRHESAQRALSVDALQTDGPVRDEAESELSLVSIDQDDSPIVKLVHSTLYDALQAGASDVHFETAVSGLAIRYRLDGVLSQVATMPGSETAEQCLSRLKVMAELDIAERRVPQDGRFRLRMQGRDVDFRVSIMPSMFGEDAVLRILDRRQLADQFAQLRLENLGFDQESVAQMRRFAREPYGMILVTGPTGSGKTTTLYAALSEINSGDDKIVTIEDPIEYHLPGILQIPVNEKKGLTFARGLRSILRHDPDKILVGEIRDGETAQIAVQSALTGHLVFTTVHANNVFDVIGRFIHMGVDPYNFIAAINAIFAQRLIRANCEHCAQPVQYPDEQLLAAGFPAEMLTSVSAAQGQGCAHCRGVGFRGRRAIAEVLHLTDEIRELIIQRAPMRQIKAVAAEQGTRTLRAQALELVRQGVTSLAEADRVTFVA